MRKRVKRQTRNLAIRKKDGVKKPTKKKFFRGGKVM